MQHNQMELNNIKTKIIIHRSNNADQFMVDSIENVNSTKLLGVLISDIDTTCNTAIPYCYTLNKTNKILNICA